MLFYVKCVIIIVCKKSQVLSDKSTPQLRVAQRKEKIMTYNKTQYTVDKERGVFRVMGICFENNASDNKIEEVFSEISSMNVVAPALMTRQALCLYIKAPEYVLERMATMPVGSSFEYDGLEITRWSNLTYNGKPISHI